MERPESCDSCYKAADCKFKFKDVDEVDVLIVSDFPERRNSEYYQIIAELASAAGIPEGSWALTSAVKHRDGKDAKVSEITACRPVLQQEFRRYNPKAIVTMGGNGLKSVLDKTGINSVRGQVLELGDRHVVPTYTVGMIAYNPDNLPIMVDDFKRAYETATTGVPEAAEVDYTTITDMMSWRKLLKQLKAQDKFAFDIETNDSYADSEGPNPYREGAKILAISFCWEERVSYSVPLWCKQTPFTEEELDDIHQDLVELMGDPSIKKIAHNGKFDTQYLLVNKGIETKGYWFDTMLAHYMCNEEKGTHGLKRLAWQYTDMGGYDAKLDEAIERLRGDQKNQDNIPLETMTWYCAADADVTWRLVPVLLQMLEDEGQTDLFFNHTMRMHHALLKVEMAGIGIDMEFLEELETEFPKRIEASYESLREYPEVLEVERRLTAKAQADSKKPVKPVKINLNSYQQVQDLLFDVMDLTPVKHTEKHTDWNPSHGIRKASTDDDVLKELMPHHELVAKLMDHRKLVKFYGTYIKPVRSWIGPDGLVHSSYLIHGTVTGRLSSQRPNAQNIPREDTAAKVGINYKNLFIPRKKGNVIIQADYSQMEMRVLAMFCKDPVLLEAFFSGQDLHKYAAHMVGGIPLDEITKEIRQVYKTLQFGIVYCKGPRSMAEELHWYLKNGEPDTKRAIKTLDKYFARYKKVRPWIQKTQKAAQKDKYVTNLFGRKRRLPGVDSFEDYVKAESLRQAVNAPIQATASDITMWSLYTFIDAMEERGFEAKVNITVHDSIVIDCPEHEAEEVIELLLSICNNPPFEWINVPIKIDVGLGYTWGELVDLE